MRGVNRSLLSPRWVLLHLVFLAAFGATLWLGWWQWESAHEAGGSFRNLGYALQWPLFGAFVLFLWYQVARMDQRPPEESSGAAVEHDEEPAADVRQRRRPLVPPPAPSVDPDEDPDLAAYNRYLAELNDRDERG